MDRRTPYSLSVLAPSTAGPDESKTVVQARLRQFVLEFQLDNAFIYRFAYQIHEYWKDTDQLSSDQLRQNAIVKQYYCDIDMTHLIAYNEELAHKLTTEPAEIIPIV